MNCMRLLLIGLLSLGLLPLGPISAMRADDDAEATYAFFRLDPPPLLTGNDGAAPDYVPLMRLLTQYVSPESWEAGGGPGRIICVDDQLLVYQRPEVQVQINRFFKILKSAAATKLPGLEGRPLAQFGNVAIDPFPDSRKSRNAPYPLIYPLADLPKKLNFATDRDPVGGAAAERSLDELITAVSLPPSTDASAEQGISLLGSADCRMILQTEAEHRKLVQFLTALRKTHSQLQPGTPGRRTIEYRLFDSNGDQLSPNRLGVVAIRLQAELRQLDWDDNEHFIVVDKQLVISQTDAGHKAIYRKLIEWWITAKTDAPLFTPPEPQGAK